MRRPLPTASPPARSTNRWSRALDGPFDVVRRTPGLAVGVTPSADQTVWQVRLRSGVRFQGRDAVQRRRGARQRRALAHRRGGPCRARRPARRRAAPRPRPLHPPGAGPRLPAAARLAAAGDRLTEAIVAAAGGPLDTSGCPRAARGRSSCVSAAPIASCSRATRAGGEPTTSSAQGSTRSSCGYGGCGRAPRGARRWPAPRSPSSTAIRPAREGRPATHDPAPGGRRDPRTGALGARHPAGRAGAVAERRLADGVSTAARR